MLLIAHTFQLVFEIVRMPHSLYHCFARWWIRGDYSCMEWLMRNKYYLVLHPWAFVAAYMAVVCAAQLDMGIPHIRPEYMIIAAIGFLFSIILHHFFIYRKINKQ